MSIIDKLVGDANKRYLKAQQPLIDKINNLEEKFEKFSDEKLKEKTKKFQEKLNSSANQKEVLDDLLPEAFALVREAAKRTLKQRHYDCQLIGGIVLHEGKIAEMKTGEGKTLAATLPLYLNTLTGKGCHLITVNDYLARRDAVWMGQIYHFLGLSVGCLNHEQSFLYDPDYKKPPEEREKMRDKLGGFYVVEDFLSPCSRKQAYEADITYGTNNEFGFDYLRDNMAFDSKQMVQRGFHYAILDEIDSILIDEARTPLIISAPDRESSKWYQEFAKIIPRLNPKNDYEIDEKMRVVTLTEEGIKKVEKILGMKNIYEEKGIRYLRFLEQALRAQAPRPTTGTPFFAKDKEYVVKDGQIVIVDEFTGRLMPGRRWSGGLHQAIEAKEKVEVKPESLTLASITFQNYFRMYEKLAGMTGTAASSAEEFDKVYGLGVVVLPTNKPLIRKALPDRVYKTEAGKFKSLVKEVKERNKRGQPILVGTRSVEKNEYISSLLKREGIAHQVLNAKNHQKEGEIIAQAGRLGQVTVATNMAGRGVDIVLGGNPQDEKEYKKIIELGGLHVIGTERHEARRIDDQLRGRAGRQGDPGSSQFFLSLEDDLLRIFGGERIKSLMSALKIPEDEPIEANLISKAVEASQEKIEGMHFDARKHVLEYDDVLNKHRKVIYKQRKELLEVKDWKSEIINLTKKSPPAGGEKKALEEKIKELGENFDLVAKSLTLRILDMFWMRHLENMQDLRDSVKLRAYGQLDPLVEYKREGHKMFKELLDNIEKTTLNTILRAKIAPPKMERRIVPLSKPEKKVGRNSPCPCGKINPKTGKPMKYKKCCWPKYG